MYLLPAEHDDALHSCYILTLVFYSITRNITTLQCFYSEKRTVSPFDLHFKM